MQTSTVFIFIHG